jgi:hypothetical protein
MGPKNFLKRSSGSGVCVPVEKKIIEPKQDEEKKEEEKE